MNNFFKKKNYYFSSLPPVKRLYSEKSYNFTKIYLNQIQLSDYKSFADILTSNKIKPNTDYLVLIKVRYNLNLFAMAGVQFTFRWNSLNDYRTILDLQDSIVSRLELLTNSYNLETYDYVCLYFKQVKYDNSIVKNDLNNNSNKLSVSNNAELTNNMRMDLYKYDIIFGSDYLFSKGIKLETIIKDDVISEIIVNMDNNSFNFLDKIRQYANKPIVFDINSSFYLHFADDRYYIINISKDNHDGSSKTCMKKAYTLKGLYLGYVVDTYLTYNILKRSFSKNTFYIHNNTVCYREKLYDFNSIKLSYKDKLTDHLLPNPNIGVFDLETYTNSSDESCVYACGFFTNLDDKSTLFYINVNKNSDRVVLDCLNSMLASKYSDVKFYCHNFGRYDVVYLLKIILAYNETTQGKVEPFKINCFFRNSVIIKLTLKKKRGKTLQSITFIDSYSILNESLKSLSSKYNVETQKGCFPHTFVNDKTLFYVGNTPDIKYFSSKEDYLKLDSWDLKEQCLIYLDKDLISLYQVITTFNKSVFKNFGLQMTNSMTISRIALDLFMTNYYSKASKVIPLVNKTEVFKDLQKAYYGGITEVYKPTNNYNETLYYYDVNSLYPYVALNKMPGLKATYLEFYDDSFRNIENYFGFFYCEVSVESRYLGLLPYRCNKGLIFPTGKWCGWYFSEQLKFAKENGYNIKIIKGYNFSSVDSVFTKYVNDLYSIKSNKDNKDTSTKLIAKSLLNNLLGRFGMDYTRPITDIVTIKDIDNIFLKHLVNNIRHIHDDKYLVSYSPEVVLSIATKLNIDPIKLLNSKSSVKSKINDNVSLPISAAVTSYGRIHISKIKLDILSMGGKIYYSDTDSIVTNIKLDDNLIASEIGKLKLEHVISKAYFISSKTYCFINSEGLLIKKAKGVDSNSMSLDNYLDLYKDTYIEALQRYSKTNYSNGEVIIGTKNITLNPNSYVKREKLYVDNKWVDTNSLFIDESFS